MVIPELIREMSKTAEEFTGMDRLRVSLLGILTAAYTRGWDDAMEAIRATTADAPSPESPRGTN
jgi:hypothetical protein